jgi:hypothetical protein
MANGALPHGPKLPPAKEGRAQKRQKPKPHLVQFPFLPWRALRNSRMSTTSTHTMMIAIVSASSAFMAAITSGADETVRGFPVGRDVDHREHPWLGGNAHMMRNERSLLPFSVLSKMHAKLSDRTWQSRPRPREDRCRSRGKLSPISAGDARVLPGAMETSVMLTWKSPGRRWRGGVSPCERNSASNCMRTTSALDLALSLYDSNRPHACRPFLDLVINQAPQALARAGLDVIQAAGESADFLTVHVRPAEPLSRRRPLKASRRQGEFPGEQTRRQQE